MRDPLGTKRQQAIVKAAKDSRVTARRIEDWDREGLNPVVEGSPKELANHYRAVADVTVRGRPSENAAVLLAGRGFACRLLQKVLYEENGLDKIPEIDPETDEGREEIERFVETMAQQGSRSKLLNAMRQNIGRVAESSDDAELKWFGFLADVATLGLGGKPFDTALVVTALGMEVVDEFRSVIETAYEHPGFLQAVDRPTRPDITPLQRTRQLIDEELPDLVRTIPYVEQYLRTLVVPTVEIEWNDEDLQTAAVIIAPSLIAGMMRAVRELEGYFETPLRGLHFVDVMRLVAEHPWGPPEEEQVVK